MTTNLLSVIEQQNKALKHILAGALSLPRFAEAEANAAIAAGEQALEQTQWEALNEFFHFGPFIDAAGIRADDKAHVVINKLQSAIQQHFSAKAAHPQATEPAPSTAGEQVDADDWVVREDILSMARATGAEEVIGNWLFYMTGSHLERFAAALLSAPSLPVGELTLLDTPEPDKYVDCGEARPLPMFHLSTLLQYGARIAAARTQPVREPLPIERLREIERNQVYNNTATLIDFARAIEAAHGIK